MVIKTGLTQSYLSTSLIASTSFLNLANFNNLSNQGFSFADYNTLMGAVPLAGTWRRWWFQQRVVNFATTIQAKSKCYRRHEFYYEFSPKFNVTASYFFKLLRSKFNQTQLQKKISRSKTLFQLTKTRHPTPTGPDTL